MRVFNCAYKLNACLASGTVFLIVFQVRLILIILKHLYLRMCKFLAAFNVCFLIGSFFVCKLSGVGVK